MIFQKDPYIHTVKVRIFLFVLLAACRADAQPVNLSDSLRAVFQSQPRPLVKLDTRHGFITGTSSATFGVKAGLNWRKTLSVGLGYHWVASRPKELTEDGQEPTVRLHYIAPFIEYTFYRKGLWQATIPVQVGFGRSFLKMENGEKTAVGNMVLYEPAMMAEYNILNLFSLGGGLGYRLVVVGNKDIDARFTSPVYLFRFRVLLDEWYRRATTE